MLDLCRYKRYALHYMVLCSLAVYSAIAMAAAPKIPLIVVDEARTDTVIKQVPLSGSVTSPKISRISAQVSGLVKVVKVDIGNHIGAGDVLLQLDNEIEELSLKASRAATRQARAKLLEAKRRFENAERLKRQNNISIEEINNREAQVNIEQAALEKQIAEEHKQKAILKRFSVTAPFAGVVSEKLTDVGEWITPGKAVFTLIAMDQLRIDFRVPQEFYTRIDQHSRVSLTLDALPGRVYAATIETVVPVSDPSARTFLMRVMPDNFDARMTPGMSVQGALQLDSDTRGVVVARDALLRYPDGRVTVWIVKHEDGSPKVFERPVKIGNSFDGQIAILKGVQAGAMVVVQGNESLQEGQTVRIQQSTSVVDGKP